MTQALPLTEASASAAVQKALDETGQPGQMVVDTSKTLIAPFGWFFFAESQAFMQSGNPIDRVPGVGAIAVEQATGRVQFLPTNTDPARAMEAFTAEWEAHVKR